MLMGMKIILTSLVDHHLKNASIEERLEVNIGYPTRQLIFNDTRLFEYYFQGKISLFQG